MVWRGKGRGRAEFGEAEEEIREVVELGSRDRSFAASQVFGADVARAAELSGRDYVS